MLKVHKMVRGSFFARQGSVIAGDARMWVDGVMLVRDVRRCRNMAVMPRYGCDVDDKVMQLVMWMMQWLDEVDDADDADYASGAIQATWMIRMKWQMRVM